MTRALLLLALLASPAGASKVSRPIPKGSGCEIVEHGTYAPVSNPIRHEDPDSVTGTWTQVDEIRFLDRTRSITARLERSFGYRFRIRDLPAHRDVRVTWRVRFPRPIHNSPAWERSFDTSVPGGELVSHLGYTFDHEFEMVPGPWIVEVLVDGRRACSLRFDVK